MSCMNRYGKPVVLDMMDLNMYKSVDVLYEQIWQAQPVALDMMDLNMYKSVEVLCLV